MLKHVPKPKYNPIATCTADVFPLGVARNGFKYFCSCIIDIPNNRCTVHLIQISVHLSQVTLYLLDSTYSL